MGCGNCVLEVLTWSGNHCVACICKQTLKHYLFQSIQLIWLFICYFRECLVKGKRTFEDLSKSCQHVCLLLGCFMLFLKVVNLLGDKKACSANFGYPMFSKFPTVSFGTTPQPTNSDHQDYEPFLVRNFYKPSFVTIASWVGGRPKVS